MINSVGRCPVVAPAPRNPRTLQGARRCEDAFTRAVVKSATSVLRRLSEHSLNQEQSPCDAEKETKLQFAQRVQRDTHACRCFCGLRLCMVCQAPLRSEEQSAIRLEKVVTSQ